LSWARVKSVGIASAVVLVLMANAPAVLVDPLQNAVAQVRWNANSVTRAEKAALLAETQVEAPVSTQKVQ
jgi:hypothetical protein